MTTRTQIAGALLAVSLLPWTGAAQGPGGQGFPGGPGRQGPGGMGGPMQPERKLVAQFDKDGDKVLNAAERKESKRKWEQDRRDRQKAAEKKVAEKKAKRRPRGPNMDTRGQT